MKRVALASFLAILAAAIPAYAHHSFAGDYLEDQKIVVEGELVEFQFRSPHSWVHVMGKNADGTPQAYAAEWASAVRLKSMGMAADTLKVGDHVVLTGAPGRNRADHKMHLKAIERPSDGWRWGGDRNAR